MTSKLQKAMRLTLLGAGIMLGAAPVAAAETVMSLIHTTPLPDITGGDFDHFAPDLKTNRLYVTAEEHRSVEVFNLKTGAHLASIGGFTTPHSIYLVPDLHELFIADGGAGNVKVMDTRSHKIVAQIPSRLGADAALYDPKTRLLYVVNGGVPDNNAPGTDITIISVDQKKIIGKIASPTNNTESLAIDHATQRMFANLRGNNTIGVFDLKTGQLAATWGLDGLKRNTPLTFDPQTHRLFLVTREPAMLAVVDTDNGKLLSQTPAVDTADDMTYDSAGKRLFVSGAGGVDVFTRIDADHFKQIQHFDTKGGKTSTYVKPLHQFYVVHTKDPTINAEAGLEIYHVSNAGQGKS